MDELLSCLRAAAEPTRLRLLALCAEGDMTVSEFTQALGQSQPRVSRHLKLLCDAGLLDRFREGSWVFYRLADDNDAPGEIARKLIALMPADDDRAALDRRRLGEIKAARVAAADQYFRANADRWDRIRSLHVDEREIERALLAAFPDRVGDLLDIGTGTGGILRLLASRIDRGVGIDQSREMLSVARANLEAAGCRHCHVRHGDMYRLEMPEASFDAVTIHQVLHYADDPASVVEEAARMLRPGGVVLIVDFAPHALETLRADHAHRRLGFTDREISTWCADAGLVAGGATRFVGDPLTVTIWTAELPLAGPVLSIARQPLAAAEAVDR
jgi:ArsR family transcriptional regulator